MSSGPSPICFSVPEFQSTITLNQDILTEFETAVAPSTSFICDVNVNKSLFCDTFLFTTDDIDHWNTSNLEKIMFIINNSKVNIANNTNTPTTTYNWKSYVNTSYMFNISTSMATDNTLHVFDYTTKVNVNVTEVYCAWYMSKLLNGIKDAQVLVKNANTIQNTFNDMFLTNVWNTMFDNILWHYNYHTPNTDVYSVLNPTANQLYIQHDSRYQNLTLLPDNHNCYGIPFITNNTPEQQTLPQRLFEQMAFKDLERLPTISSGNHITLGECFPGNSSSNIQDTILINHSDYSINTNVYRFPFIAGDTFIFKLSVMVNQNNTLNIFNALNGGNVTTNINALNTVFNDATDEGNGYLSYLVRMTLVDPAPILEGTFIYSFDLTTTPPSTYYRNGVILPQNLNFPIPINTNNGDVKYTYNVSVTQNTYLVTVSYKIYSETSISGLTFVSEDSSVDFRLGAYTSLNSYVTDFYNTYTTNLTIIQFGNIPFDPRGRQFKSLNSLTILPTAGIPTFYPNTYLLGCFENCPTFNSDISSWNTTNVYSFQNMFLNASSFNQPIGNWDTSNSKAFAGMFASASSFNQYIGNWNVSKPGNFGSMFNSATSFNNGQPAGMSTAPLNWNTINATSFGNLFYNATSFNQPIGTWNTSKVTTMRYMFYGATLFNQPIGTWNTSSVTDMTGMFNNTNSFNQPIGTWNTSSVTDMNNMFYKAYAFNQPIGTWNTSKVTNMTYMFSVATSFNQNLSSWDMSKVTNITNMFSSTSSTLSSQCKFNNGQIMPSITGTATSASYVNSTKTLTCPDASFLTELVVGDVLLIEMTSAIYSSVIQSITNATTLVLTTAYGTNISAGAINSIKKQVAGTSPLTWSLINCTNMNSAFRNCLYFNQNISQTVNNWNMNKVADITQMFQSSSANSKHLFNNGQLITGTTAPLNWSFTSTPVSTNWRQYCYLSNANNVSNMSLP
jgi:surface protein